MFPSKEVKMMELKVRSAHMKKNNKSSSSYKYQVQLVVVKSLASQISLSIFDVVNSPGIDHDSALSHWMLR